MVGDSLRDVEAGIRTGMRTVFVVEPDTVTTAAAHARGLATISVSSLRDFVQRLLAS